MKINTSTGAGGPVTVARVKFDRHLDTCTVCTQHSATVALCQEALVLWRKVCKAAVNAAKVVK